MGQLWGREQWVSITENTTESRAVAITDALGIVIVGAALGRPNEIASIPGVSDTTIVLTTAPPLPIC